MRAGKARERERARGGERKERVREIKPNATKQNNSHSVPGGAYPRPSNNFHRKQSTEHVFNTYNKLKSGSPIHNEHQNPANTTHQMQFRRQINRQDLKCPVNEYRFHCHQKCQRWNATQNYKHCQVMSGAAIIGDRIQAARDLR